MPDSLPLSLLDDETLTHAGHFVQCLVWDKIIPDAGESFAGIYLLLPEAVRNTVLSLDLIALKPRHEDGIPASGLLSWYDSSSKVQVAEALSLND